MKPIFPALFITLLAARCVLAAEANPVTVTRLADNPIIRPEMMPKNDGEWSGNIDFPCVIRVPQWVEKPLGKYYLYFSAHRGTYIRLAYADNIAGPWKIYEPGTLRMEQVEGVNLAAKGNGRHVASPDIQVDNEHKQIRMYFHFLLPKLGHKSSVAVSGDGLAFEPQAGVIGGPYLRVFKHAGAYFAVEDGGAISRSPDGLQPFKSVSNAVTLASGGNPAAAHFRHAGLWLDGDTLGVFYSRVGDAPEQILLTKLALTGDPANWKASSPVPVLAPERDYEGSAAPIAPSTPVNQTHVRQLRDPFVFREGERAWLLYAVAGETGIAIADLKWVINEK
ncbi:MAG TPA: hypothetical protein VKX17_19570 [Planctomycetota bacterium]|nr:hypothetical protein [Planctomycetota bacterium]